MDRILTESANRKLTLRLKVAPKTDDDEKALYAVLLTLVFKGEPFRTRSTTLYWKLVDDESPEAWELAQRAFLKFADAYATLIESGAGAEDLLPMF